MRRILLLATCLLGLLAISAPPATNLQYFAGNWSCSGTFPATGRTIASTLVFEPALGGAGVVARQDDMPPNAFHASFLWGPAPDGSLVSIVQDSTGGVRRFVSPGWTADTLLWQSDPTVTPAQQFSYRRLDANSMEVEWLVMRTGTYRVGDVLRCKRTFIQEDASLRSTLVSRIQARLDAFASGDRTAWKSDLDPNALIVDEEGRVRTPSAFLTWLSPLPSGSSGTLRVSDVHFARSNDVAAVTFVAREHESIYNARFFARFSFVDTYHARNGEWLLVSEQQTRLQLDPPTVVLPAASLKQYIGRYRMAGAPYVFAVSIVNEQLEGGTEGSKPFAMHAIADQPNMFFRSNHPALYIFAVSNGHATQLIDRRYYNRDARYNRIT